MTKVLMVILAVFMCVGLTTAVFAQESGTYDKQVFEQKMGVAKEKAYTGTVLSHDVACHCIVVKLEKGTLTLQDDYAKFEGDYNRAKGLKIGTKIGGMYKTVDYINYATSVRYEK
jgi:hypothetical protein